MICERAQTFAAKKVKKVCLRVNHLLKLFWRIRLKPRRFARRGKLGDRMMQLKTVNIEAAKPVMSPEGEMMVAQCLAAAAQGDIAAYFDLGVAYSTGSHGVDCDMIEAHKWFNLAAAKGHEEAAYCRADISDEMTAREIAEAQRQAREWLSAERRKAA